jgi:hypothetical protein
MLFIITTANNFKPYKGKYFIVYLSHYSLAFIPRANYTD